MLRFGETKVAREEFYGARKPIKFWDVDVDNIVVSWLALTKTNSKYLIEYFHVVRRPLVLILPEINEYVKILIKLKI